MNRRHRSNPSFSSSLLDEIYRSIDEGERSGNKGDTISVHSKKRTAEKLTCHRKMNENVEDKRVDTWSSSFSNREFTVHRPNSIRTDFVVKDKFDGSRESLREQKVKNENGFGKTKSKAMKIYRELKKVKQPISPGGRLTTFLNSIFTTTTPKKPKISSSTRKSFDETITRNIPKSNSFDPSTCSSASSFSRSCLINSSSRELSREKTSNGAKRSVRFYPDSVVLGKDSKKEMRNTINEELKVHIMEQNRRVEEVARNLLKNYQKLDYRMKNGKHFDDDNEDAASYASSDLFELDHLSVMEELPVYETTLLSTNLAIAKGLIS